MSPRAVPSAGVFARVRRRAEAWMKDPDEAALRAVAESARAANEHVPEARRADWEKLLAGFGASEGEPRRRARVQALARACALFEGEWRERERRTRTIDWADPVDRADGLGPASRRKLAAHGVEVVADLVWTLPVGWDDLRAPLAVGAAVEAARVAERSLSPAPRVCVRGVVRAATLVPMRGRRAVRVVVAGVEEASGPTLDAWWFYEAHGVLATARPGAVCLLVGRVRALGGKRPSMAHPEVVRDDPSARALRPRYAPLGVAPASLRRAVADVLARGTPLPDPIPPEVARRESMPPVEPLLRAVHGASDDPSVPSRPDARRELASRLAWVEAFARVRQRLAVEQASGDARAPVLAGHADRAAGAVAALGFTLTAAQRRAIDAIVRDLGSPAPMRRLLLGDVGTGKTAVALAAAAQCVSAGYQCALLAPTGILAEQYVDATAPVARALEARVECLTSASRSSERRAALSAIAAGEAHLVVGTHALLDDEVRFARLGLVVVDEQHRLGVAQRLALVRKGAGTRPHLLSLSATPIPRTLALAMRGELAASVLDERPRGRGPVATELRPRAKIEEVLDDVRATTARGERVFFVCPRIDDDPDEEQVGAEARARQLAERAGSGAVVLVHGGLSPAARAGAMRAFRRGDAAVLVGTTVVEVGVDVPEATLMVVDGAERFGLAQLHQLRGRVGRGSRPGRCVLLHDEPLAGPSRARLEAVATTPDGDAIARADLALRGAGDLGGTRQSGAVEDFVWLDAADPPPWIERIDADTRALVARDPDLSAPEHRALALAVRRFAATLAVREEAG